MCRKISVLFVSHTACVERPYYDPSTRYRTYHLADELARRGHRSHATSLSFFEQRNDIADRYDFIVFHRPRVTPSTADFFLTNEKSPRIVADFDDLIFDVSLSDMTPAVRVRGSDRVQNRVNLASFAAASALFGICTTSTEPLREHMMQLFAIPPSNAHVIPNGLDPAFIGLCRLARENAPLQRPHRFGYFSGTQSHDLDFTIAAPALAKALQADREATVLVVGPVQIPAELSPFSDRIITRPVVPFHELPFLKAQVCTVIAPLEDTPFNRSKSGLKFWEAALVGCSAVATPIPDIDRFDSPLLRKCVSSDNWSEALLDPFVLSSKLIREEAERIAELTSIGRQADSWLERIAGNA